MSNTMKETTETSLRTVVTGWRSKAKQLINQAEAMELRASHQGEYGSPAASMWRAVSMCLSDCARELEASMICPQGSRETSVDDDRASSPSYHGHLRCKKCGEVHWMHGDCKFPENETSPSVDATKIKSWKQ
jgi:hypothetical protein